MQIFIFFFKCIFRSKINPFFRKILANRLLLLTIENIKLKLEVIKALTYVIWRLCKLKSNIVFTIFYSISVKVSNKNISRQIYTNIIMVILFNIRVENALLTRVNISKLFEKLLAEFDSLKPSLQICLLGTFKKLVLHSDEFDITDFR